MLSSDDLRFFCVVANQPTLAATARVLNVTPPSVTQRLQAIEEKLGLRLLDRFGRRTRLTDEGELLAARARTILEDMDALVQALGERKNDMVGCLRILAPLGFGNAYVAPLAARFQAEHPMLSVELELSDRPNLAAGDGWDIVVHIGALRDSNLQRQVLARNRRVLCAAPSYLEQHGMPQSLAELRRHRCLMLRENAEDVGMWRLRAPDASHFETVRIDPVLTSNDGRAVKQWALAGYGIMQRSGWDVAQELRSKKLVQVLPGHHAPDADIVALLGAHKGRRSARTERFLELLKQAIGPMPWDAQEHG
jgi:DNA-binding transcriptional LysR family regulator